MSSAEEAGIRVFDARGKVTVRLTYPDGGFDAHRVIACGKTFCGITHDRLVIWSTRGDMLDASSEALLGPEPPWLIELARGKAGTFILGRDERPRVFRIEGLPRP